MQSNIFAKVAPLLKEKKYDIDVDNFVRFMGFYNHRDWVYPSAIHRKLKIDIKVVYEILEFLVTQGYIESYLQINCPNCQKYTGHYYKSIGEIPKVVYCPHCDSEIIDPLKYAVLIYRVL